ncbi:hypothetical protein MRX96_042198 [Rhipicephalus microplus]
MNVMLEFYVVAYRLLATRPDGPLYFMLQSPTGHCSSAGAGRYTQRTSPSRMGWRGCTGTAGREDASAWEPAGPDEGDAVDAGDERAHLREIRSPGPRFPEEGLVPVGARRGRSVAPPGTTISR